MIASGLLAGKVHFGVWFRLLMEAGVIEEFLAAQYLLAIRA
jgi:hypothetical protein